MPQMPKFRGGIDTIEIASTTDLEGKSRFFSHDNTRKITKNDQYLYRFSPSLVDDIDVYSLTGCVSAIEIMLEETELENPRITRIDFCFDDYEHDYRDLYKLNQLFFCLMINKYGIKNDYLSNGLQSPLEKTIRIQKSWMEGEFYNKKAEEPKGDILCRLELRSKLLKDDGIRQPIINALEKWQNDFAFVFKLTSGDLDDMLKEMNDQIISHFEEDVVRDECDQKDYRSMIQRYHRYIYTRKQLVDLIRRMGFQSYESIVSKYKTAHAGLQLFKIRDICKYVTYISGVADQFLAA